MKAIPIICIDPGHNAFGVDAGAEAYGLREQDVTLDIAHHLRPLLEYNELLARAHAKGICDFFGVEYWEPSIQ